MGTIAEQINYLADTKTAIKEALVAKGVSVGETDTFRSYADKIASIETGGGGSASAMEYWEAPSPLPEGYGELVLYSSMVKTQSNGVTYIAPSAWGAIYPEYLALAIDRTLQINIGDGLTTIGEIFDNAGLDFGTLGFSQITEEEFYSIN